MSETPMTEARKLQTRICYEILKECLRQERGPKYLSKRLGGIRSVQRINNLLMGRGRRPMSLDEISDLALALGCEPDWSITKSKP